MTFSRTQNTASWLVIAIANGLLFSPPLANLAEFLLVVLVLYSPELRAKLILAWRQPLARAAIAFWLVTGIGVFYSAAPLPTTLSMWGGWRKLLLLPLALALFDDPRLKTRFLLVFIATTSITAILGFVNWHLHSDTDNEAGVLIRNHSTQGMIYATSAFGATVLALRKCIPAPRWLLPACSVLLVAAITILTPGRSGYLVLLICSAALAYSQLFDKHVSWKSFAGAGLIVALMASVLAITPTSRDRIKQAFTELTQYKQAKEETSIGIRVIFWTTALELIRNRPFSGYGTGAFGEAYSQLVAGRTGLAGLATGDPHNQYLKIAAEHGLPGLVLFLAMLAAALRQTPSGSWRLLGVGVLVSWCATSLANSHFSTFNEGTFIYLWLGVMLAQERQNE